MTEKDLLAYRRAVSEYNRSCEELSEFCPAFYAANVSHITGLPKSTPPASPDRMTPGIATHIRYVERWRKAVAEMEEKRDLLGRVNDMLDVESERQFLYYRYVKGMKTAEISKKIHRSVSSLVRDRAAIITIISTIPYPV